MTCALCAGKGVIRIGYHEPPSDGYVDYGICYCHRGNKFRIPGFRRVLAERFGVDVEQVNLIEELLDAEDLPEYVPPVELDIADAGRRVKRAKL